MPRKKITKPVKDQNPNLLGKIYVVATPIGNLKDITLRALEVLKQADIILTERRTTTYKLLNHYDIHDKKLLTYREDNHNKIINLIIHFIKQGKDIALVSEAGTPVIADPGLRLIQKIKQVFPEVKLVPVPGPSAITAAISVFDKGRSPKFLFLGFAPTKPTRIVKFLQANLNMINKQKLTIVYFLPSKLISKTLTALQEFSETKHKLQIGLAKELTKIHEQIITGTPKQILKILKNKPELTKGEFVLLITLAE